MTNSFPLLDETRLAFAKSEIEKYHDKIAPDMQQAILLQRIVLDMSPYEARLAGGAFYFKVVADPKVWPTNADPYDVMWGQSLHPDNSDIWMAFENTTQYPGLGLVRFHVHFEHGRATLIEKLGR